MIVAPQEDRNTERHGSEYGGWDVLDHSLNRESNVYSFGVGTDISFDLSLIEKYGVTVNAFDPTPRSCEWVRSQRLPPQFHFHDFGIGRENGTLRLFPPADDRHVSFTVIDRNAAQLTSIEFPVRRLSNIMKDLGDRDIEVLKMDIEGAEYEVIPTLREDGIYPPQLLVEFHHRFFPDGIRRTRDAIRSLNDMGYRIVSVSPSGEEFTFVRTPKA